MTRQIAYLGLLLIAVVLVQTANAQGGAKPCASPPKPKTRAEALMMESSSNKNGCWIRQKNQDGTDDGLVFVSKEAPDKNYKPLISPAAPSPGTPVAELSSPDAAKIPSDPCKADRADAARLQQWVQYDRLKGSSTLSINEGKLAAASQRLEKCQNDSLIGTWIMVTRTILSGRGRPPYAEGAHKYLVTITLRSPNEYVLWFKSATQAKELQLSRTGLVLQEHGDGQCPGLKLEITGGSIQGIFEGNDTCGESKVYLTRPSPGGIEVVTASVTAICAPGAAYIGALRFQRGYSDDYSESAVSEDEKCTPGKRIQFSNLNPGPFWSFQSGDSGEGFPKGCEVQMALQPGEKKEVNMGPMQPNPKSTAWTRSHPGQYFYACGSQ